MTPDKKPKIRWHHRRLAISYARSAFVGISAILVLQYFGIDFDDGAVFYLSLVGTAVLISFCAGVIEIVIELVRNARNAQKKAD